MKFLIFVFLIIGFILPAFGQSMGDISDRIWLPNCPIGTSTECDQSSLFPDAIGIPFFQSDSVAIGTIVEKDSGNQDSIRYSLDVDFYLKNYQQFDLLTAVLANSTEPPKFPDVLYYNSPVFNKGDLVFVYLKKIDGQYNVLPQSFALDKHEVRGPPPDILLPKSPSQKVFQQGEKILVSGEVRKLELVGAVKQGKKLDAKLMIKDSDDRNNMVFSDLMKIEPDGNYNYFLDTSKIPPGKFELEVNYGPSTSGTEITVEPNFKIWTPLKQHSFGISNDEIQCSENLVLIQKHDGSPACVKSESSFKLEKRNWGFSYTTLQTLVENSDEIITGMVVGVDNRLNGERHVWLGSYEWLQKGIYDEQQLFLEQSERNPRPMEVPFSKGEEVLLFLKNVDVKRGAYDLLSINGIPPQKYPVFLRDSVWSFFDNDFYKIETKPENSSNCSEKFFGTDKYSYCTTKKSSYIPVSELMDNVRAKMLENISEEYLEGHFDLRVVSDQPDPVYEPGPNAGPYIPPEKAKRQNIEFVYSIDGMDFVYSMNTKYLEEQQKIELQYIPPREIKSLASQKEIDNLIQSCLDGKYKFLHSPPYIGYHDEYGFSPAVGGHGPPTVFDRWSDDRVQEREMVFRIWLAESDVECSLHDESFDPDHSKRPDLVPLIDLIETTS